MHRTLRIIACYIHKWQLRMEAMECGVVTQRAAVLLLLLLQFVNLLNKKLGSPGNTKVRGFHHLANVRNSQ